MAELKIDIAGDSESNETYRGDPPTFGHPMHKFFFFDPTYVNLNNGSYGSLSRPVKAACDKFAAQTESNPDMFYRFEYAPLLIAARARVAHLLHAEPDECVLVLNASTALDTVLRNFQWNAGDIIVQASTTYSAVLNMIQYQADRPPHPTVSTFSLKFPNNHASIISDFRAHLRTLPERSAPLSTDGGRKIVAIIDGIIASPAAYLPWKDLVQVCREEGVWSIVDAAHCIGQEVDINLSEAKPDFWVSNCHKWLYAKRPCAVLYVPLRNQHIIRASIPTPDAYKSPDADAHYPEDFVALFEWNGTMDFAPFLSVCAALDFREWLGGEAKINAYCHALALAGGQRLAEILGTSVMGSEELILNIVNVELPIPGSLMWTPAISAFLRQRLLLEWKIFAPPIYHNGRWWTRCSAQIWNEISDFEYLGKVWKVLCKEVIQKYGTS
ncbi:hypothetical protein PLICRDRAFT_106338 [Plicaturopsis crispa FD-325 SS-3]|nr:hypothetical protein PLICRDRAFT_106338 [Plicaturopsis crispa FD-325 SS-3]